MTNENGQTLKNKLISGISLATELIRTPAEVIYYSLRTNLELIGSCGEYCQDLQPVVNRISGRITRNYDVLTGGSD